MPQEQGETPGVSLKKVSFFRKKHLPTVALSAIILQVCQRHNYLHHTPEDLSFLCRNAVGGSEMIGVEVTTKRRN